VDPTRREHWNLKLGIDGWSAPWLGTNRGHQIHVRLNMALRLAREALDTPHNRLLFGFVLGTAKRVLDLGLGGVFGDGYLDHDVGRKELVREIGNDLEVDGNLCQALFFLNGRNDSKGQIDIVRDSVFHELKLAIRGNKGNGPICIKLSEADASVKGTVVNVDAGFSLSLLFDDELVVETKLALWHPRQFRVHLDSTRNLVAQNISGAG